ncbi:hypothetical protein NEICINOT_03300 [Neisseria cinerea ATCC 14685]|uniref:Uncharacterized protein n=1 Tax=Neisseria cinerea ATCC 14685 TaxID=546262 RepID=D0W0Y1_NEICI|nr:hypothetical protein NEICINOT_03300 [Neisseria cinerea ATCC 14685]
MCKNTPGCPNSNFFEFPHRTILHFQRAFMRLTHFNPQRRIHCLNPIIL